LPGLFKQGSGAGLVTGGVEGAATLQQGAQAGPWSRLGEAGFYLVEQLVRLCKLALQRMGAGYLGEELQLPLQVGGTRLGQQCLKTLGAGNGILIIPQCHEIGRIVHLASMPVIRPPRCLKAILCTRRGLAPS